MHVCENVLPKQNSNVLCIVTIFTLLLCSLQQLDLYCTNFIKMLLHYVRNICETSITLSVVIAVIFWHPLVISWKRYVRPNFERHEVLITASSVKKMDEPNFNHGGHVIKYNAGKVQDDDAEVIYGNVKSLRDKFEHNCHLYSHGSYDNPRQSKLWHFIFPGTHHDSLVERSSYSFQVKKPKFLNETTSWNWPKTNHLFTVTILVLQLEEEHPLTMSYWITKSTCTQTC